MYCKSWSIESHNPHRASATPLYCKSWKCEECAPRRRAALQAKAMDGQPTTFITLTIRPDFAPTRGERARALAKAWRNLRLYAMRRFKLKEFPFLAIFEPTESGNPHLHILARVRYLPQKWISLVMLKYLGSPVVDIRAVRKRKTIARYVSKYISKSPTRFEGCKRYWPSKDWIPENKKWQRPACEPGTVDALRQVPSWQVAREYLARGWRAIVHSDKPDHWTMIAPGVPPP